MSAPKASPVEPGPAASRPPLRVFFTVDTEFSPRDFSASNGEIEALVARDIDGITKSGSFGIGFQMDELEAHGLRAVFQVEALSASAVGSRTLERVVAEITRRGHDVQLHVHPEWLAAIDDPALPAFKDRNLVSYTEDEQAKILQRALENLRAAGARRVRAFRAGNYGANHDTLRAAARIGIEYDTSYNVCYLDPTFDGALLTQAVMVDGLCEVPISFFTDWPGHHRPAQLCACSSDELEHALTLAWQAGWKSFVIVSHSFELIKRPADPRGDAVPDKLVIDRMKRICRFLGAHRDKFQMATFADAIPSDLIPENAPGALRSKLSLTLRRVAQQIVGRIS